MVVILEIIIFSHEGMQKLIQRYKSFGALHFEYCSEILLSFKNMITLKGFKRRPT